MMTIVDKDMTFDLMSVATICNRASLGQALCKVNRAESLPKATMGPLYEQLCLHFQMSLEINGWSLELYSLV